MLKKYAGEEFLVLEIPLREKFMIPRKYTATNHLTSTKCCDQTTSATNISGITVERQYPYLSFGTWFFEIYPGVLL